MTKVIKFIRIFPNFSWYLTPKDLKFKNINAVALDYIILYHKSQEQGIAIKEGNIQRSFGATRYFHPSPLSWTRTTNTFIFLFDLFEEKPCYWFRKTRVAVHKTPQLVSWANLHHQQEIARAAENLKISHLLNTSFPTSLSFHLYDADNGRMRKLFENICLQQLASLVNLEQFLKNLCSIQEVPTLRKLLPAKSAPNFCLSPERRLSQIRIKNIQR